MNGVQIVTDPDMGKHSAAFLREARHVEHRDPLAIDVRRHADQGADGHDTGAAYAGNQYAVGPIGCRQHRRRRHAERIAASAGAGQAATFPDASPQHRDKTWAEALLAGIVLVASRLVDRPFAAEFGFHRHHREAVGLYPAIAAAFAHGLVDVEAAGRVDHLAALAATTLFGSAGLVVDDGGDTGAFAHVALDRIEFIAMSDRHTVRQIRVAVGARRTVGDDDDVMHSFRVQLRRNLGHREVAVHGLAAGHGNGVVVEDLVGDVDARRHCSTDRQRTRVEISAVAEIDEDVALLGKGRLAHPGRAFATHVGIGARGPVHPQHHEVAADASQRTRTLRYAGRCVVRATGAEVGRACNLDHRRGSVLLGFDDRQAIANARRGEMTAYAIGDDAGDLCRRQFAGGRQQPAAVGVLAIALRQHSPFALFVELADHARAHILAPVVEFFLQLILDQLALFFDHQDLFQSFGEMAHTFRFQRPDHADLVEADADFGGQRIVDAKIIEGLAYVEIGFAGGYDSEARVV